MRAPLSLTGGVGGDIIRVHPRNYFHRLKIRETLVKTRLEDLQAEMEAGARKLNSVASGVGEIRDALLAVQLEQAAMAGRLVRQVHELQACVTQQRATLRELRIAIRSVLGGARRQRR